MEQTLRSTVAPLLLGVAAVTAFAQVNHAPLLHNLQLGLLRDAAILTAGALWLGLGVRHVRRDGTRTATLRHPIAGVFVLGLVGASSYFGGRASESAIESLRASDVDIERIAAAVIADPEATPEQRVQASVLRARSAFVRTGQILPVLDEAGLESSFEPGSADREQRSLERYLPHAAANARRFVPLTAAVALASLVLGIATPVRRTASPSERSRGPG